MAGWAPRRVAITGLGAITALGNDRESTWARLVAGESGVGAIRAWSAANYPTKIAGEAVAFDPLDHFERKRARRLDRCHQLAIVATREAVKDAGFDAAPPDPTRTGIVIGTSLGGMLSGQRYDRLLHRTGRHRGALLWKYLLHVCVDELTAEFGYCGPRSLISTACTASTIAIGLAVDLIRAGQADAIVTGGVDPLSDFSFAGFSCMKNVSAAPCAPFSEPVGLTTGEGAGILIVEDMERARARGARIYAELAHHALTADAYHATSPDPTGNNQKRAVLYALDCANIGLHEVDYVNAHGTGTSGNDLTESRVLEMLFGDRAAQVPVSSVKGALGHTLGCAGGIEALITTMAVDRGVLPPTANFTTPRAGCALDYVPNKAREKRIGVAVSENFAFGGNNAVVVIARQDRESRPLRLANRRAVITGMGLLTPCGCGTASFLEALNTCRSGIAGLEGFDTGGFNGLGARVNDAELEKLTRGRLRRVDRIGHFSIAGAELALQDAGIRVSRENAERIGILIGTANGPAQSCKTFHREVAAGCPQKANAAVFPNTVLNAGAGLASINLRVRGPNVAISIGLASGLSAIVQAFELVRSGAADIAIAGGVEELEPPVFAGYAAARRMAPYQPNGAGPCEQSIPFDRRRSGMVLGEGAGFLVIESEESAIARGARIHGELCGYHMCSDRPVRAGWDPSGEGMERSMRRALEMAALAASEIGYVAAAAMSHPDHDAIEAAALNRVFGQRGVPVGALSSLFGVSAATGSMSLAAAVLGLSGGFLPAGAPCEQPDPRCDLDLVTGAPRKQAPTAVLANAASLGGTNVSIVVRSYGAA